MDHRQQDIMHNLSTFARELNVSIEYVVSFKFRPVEDLSGPSDRYLYHKEYDALAEAFKLPAIPNIYRGQRVWAYGRSIVVEHETGPELLAAVATFGQAAEPYLAAASVAVLARDMAIWLWRKVKSNCESKSPDRYYHDARYVKVEVRRVAADGTIEETVISTLDFSGLVDPETLATQMQKGI